MLKTKLSEDIELDTTYSSKKTIKHNDISILNIYTLSTRASMFVKEIQLQFKLYIGNQTLISVDFNIPLEQREDIETKT